MSSHIEKIIYYHDTDAGGVVYYSNYLKFMEEGRTEYFRERGVSIQELHKEGFLYAVRKCNVTYKSPARYGDTIVIETAVKKLSAAQIFFEHTVTRKKNQEVLVTAEISLVSLSKDFKAIPIPEPIKSKIT